MKKLMFLVALAISAPAFANICDLDPVPGRRIEILSTVIFENQYVVVANKTCKEGYDVRARDGQITTDIPRDQLSVARGCNNGHCVSDYVIDLATLSEVRIAGLSFNGGFIISSTRDGSISGPVDRKQLAITKDCIISNYTKTCVGDFVKNESNQRLKVVGFQHNEKLVLRSTDGTDTITADIDPSSVLRTR